MSSNWTIPKLTWTILLLFVLMMVPRSSHAAEASSPNARIDANLLAQAEAHPTEDLEAFATFAGPLSSEDHAALLSSGARMVRTYSDWGLAYVVGAAPSLLRVAQIPGVVRLSENLPLSYGGETATVATRAREAWDDKSTSTDPVTVGGAVVDGSGVTVAIIDSGIDGTHPDLAPALARNLKFVCSTPLLIHGATDTCYGDAILGFVLTGTLYDGCTDLFWADLDDTDTTSGHGTHVSGIVAGRGVASDGRIRGAAPGAGLIGLGVGEGINILYALEALNWIDCNQGTYGIDVVSNSWGLNAAYDATDPINVAVNDLVSDGLVVVFAAGNDGGTGTANRVNTYARNPTSGVIAVANYDDLGRASRANALSSTSSRCLAGAGGVVSNADNCPDVAAPGTSISSTVSRAGTIPPLDLRYSPYYGPASGTSMAAPHVAGVVALLLQADGSLSPADVEDVLEDNAVQFTTPGGYPASSDPDNPTNGINYGAGHGLVDAIASLQDSRVLGGSGLGSPLPQLNQNPHVYTEGLVDPQVAGGAPPALSLQWTQVAGRPVTLSERGLVSGNAGSWGLSNGQDANFRIQTPGGSITNVATTLTTDGSARQMAASYTFPSAGTYRIESQIEFGISLVSFDHLVVRLVP